MIKNLMETHYAVLCHTLYYDIRISNGVEYIGKEHSYKNSTKEVMLSIEVIFPIE